MKLDVSADRFTELETEVARLRLAIDEMCGIVGAAYRKGREDERAHQRGRRINAPKPLRHLHSVAGGAQ